MKRNHFCDMIGCPNTGVRICCCQDPPLKLCEEHGFFRPGSLNICHNNLLGDCSYTIPMNSYLMHAEFNRYNYCMDENSRTLVLINNSNSKRRKINIDTLPEKLGLLAGVCTLPSNEVFLCGGTPTSISDAALSSVYKINPQTSEWEKLSDMPNPNFRIVPILLNNYIYVFGGRDSRCNDISIAWRYSLAHNTWETLQDMPVTSFNIHCVSVGNSLLLYGKTTRGIYEYNHVHYTKIFEINSGYGILLKNHLGELFLLNQGDIYKSHEQNYYEWKKVGNYNTSILDHSLEAAPQQFGDQIFFKIWYKRYMSFDHQKLKLRLKSSDF